MRDVRRSIGRRLAALVVPGAMVLGTSCAENIRESVIAASLGFVEDSATIVLESLISVEDFVSSGE